MDVREKLVELLKEIVAIQECGFGDPRPTYKTVASYLISHGVTVQEWIPVTEMLPESGKESVLIAMRWGGVDIGWCEDSRWRSEFVSEYEDGEVTHWMPLPKPPEGE